MEQDVIESVGYESEGEEQMSLHCCHYHYHWKKHDQQMLFHHVFLTKGNVEKVKALTLKKDLRYCVQFDVNHDQLGWVDAGVSGQAETGRVSLSMHAQRNHVHLGQ